MAVFSSSPDVFLVEEIPAYLPCGVGGHTFLWLEKRGLTTPEACKRLARALEVPERDLGYAGLKDRHATTRQWVSAPGVDPARAVEIGGDGWRVLEAKRHGNKLRVGHLDGNRFEVLLRDAAPGEAAVFEEELGRLRQAGLPNRYGEQRFGATGENAAAGLEILRGHWRERDHRRRRLLLSALQSAVFNRVLALREEAGLLRVRTGDVLQKVGSGGLFICADREQDQIRVDAGEIVPTGPMPGSREMRPPPGSEARALEDRALGDVGLAADEMAGMGRDLPGARRPVVVPVGLGDPGLIEGTDGLRLRFSLPAGSYATVLLQTLAERAGTRASLVLARPNLC